MMIVNLCNLKNCLCKKITKIIKNINISIFFTSNLKLFMTVLILSSH